MTNGRGSTSSLLSLYDAMTEEASNQSSETFTAGQPHLGELSGLSAKTVQRLEPLFEEFGVVQITRPKMRGHHTYKLLSLGQGVSTLGQEDLTLGHGRISRCPPVEEHKNNKEDSSNGSEIRPSKRSARIQLVDDEHIRDLKKIYQPSNVDKAVADCKAWLLTPRGKGKAFTKRRLQTFLRDAEPLLLAEQTSATSEQIDRTEIDPHGFESYLAREHPAGLEQGWTPETAPERVIRTFLNDRKVSA